jgi:hypothetical protein
MFFTIIFAIFTLLRYVSAILLFLFDHNLFLIKLMTFLINCYIIKYIWYYPYKQRCRLSTLRYLKYYKYREYKINDHTDLDIAFSSVFLYFFTFIILLFVLRIKNMNKIFDVKILFDKIKMSFVITSYPSIILNFLLVITILLLYILVLSLLSKYIKKQIMKLHFYFIFKAENSYTERINALAYKTTIQTTLNKLNRYYQFANYPKGYKKFMYNNIQGFAFIIHRVLFLCIIFYDLRYNNMILSHMYNILPFIFVYELWLKYSIFLTGWHFYFNSVLMELLYYTVKIYDDDKEYIYIYVGAFENVYERKIIKMLLTEYVFRDFVDTFYLPKDPIIAGINHLIYYYWDYLIFERIFNKHLIDLVLLLLLVIFNL